MRSQELSVTTRTSCNVHNLAVVLKRGAEAWVRVATSVDSIIRRAQKSPGSVAIEDDGTAVTYAELADRVLQLARQVSAATEPRAVVAVEARRSLGAIAAMLAVMFAGRIYCPLDPAMPAARRRAVSARVRDAGTWHGT